ncbi:cold-responsive protein kinase 1-like [Carex rostrata]
MTCFSFPSKSRKNSIRKTSKINGDMPGLHKVKIYSYNELRDATNNFNSSNKIGQGGFGSVYKGKLRNGSVVAIKVLSAESKQGVRQFLNELSMIAKVTHENLVRLDGCCVEGDHMILIFSYLPMNSLAQTLLCGSQCNIEFNWKVRLKICIGVARGLAFLHEKAKPVIIHRDIKASNILLDNDLTPKISDFGLAKLFPANLTHISTRVAGTLGYLAPEYAIHGHLTKKADIYSFGVLLLEIVSGRSNDPERYPYEDFSLLERAWMLYEQGELTNLVDPSLTNEFDPKEANQFIKVGLLCTQEKPKTRPAISKVVEMLTGQMDADGVITKPGVITDIMDLKIRAPVQ